MLKMLRDDSTEVLVLPLQKADQFLADTSLILELHMLPWQLPSVLANPSVKLTIEMQYI